jgi:hypothetical protein
LTLAGFLEHGQGQTLSFKTQAEVFDRPHETSYRFNFSAVSSPFPGDTSSTGTLLTFTPANAI